MVEWRRSPSYPEAEVSDLGTVRLAIDRKKPPKGRWFRAGYPIASFPSDNGYWSVCLHDPEGRRRIVKVHRLVCEAFHGSPPGPRSEVNHRDCDKSNNRPGNLEWVTRSENLRHAYASGRMEKSRDAGRAAGKSMRKHDAPTVRRVRRMHAQGLNYSQISTRTGVGRATVRGIVLGLRYADVEAAP